MPHDEFWAGRLVEDTRLHFSVIMSDKYSEQFYINMCKIAKYKVYLGYKTIQGKTCKLNGIKDFFWSRHYGLGVTDMNQCMMMITRQSINDKTKQQFAKSFLDWLARQDKTFDLPPQIYEYRRLLYHLRTLPGNGLHSKKRDSQSFAWLKMIFHMYPEMLADIGVGRKYSTVRHAAVALGIEIQESVKTYRIPQYPSYREMKKFSQTIYETMGPARTKALILHLLRYYKKQNPEEARGQAQDSA